MRAYDRAATTPPEQPDLSPIHWTQPLSSAPLFTSPAAVFLRALAAELDGGAPPIYALTFSSENQVHAQLAAGRTEEPAALAAWARIFGVSTVKREERHGGSNSSRYSVASLFAGYRLEVWDAWPDHTSKGPTTHVPLAEFDRGFDEPPAAPHEASRPTYADELAGRGELERDGS
jgi:hypothetical protein